MNSLSSHALDAFMTTAQLGHFTQAAKKLHITQSALSQRILNLESELGTALLIRDRAGIRLTDAGEKLLQFCRQKALLEEECRGHLQETLASLSGEIRIGTFSSVGRSVILPALAPLLRKHTEVRLTLSTAEIRALPALLRKGEIDFLISLEEIQTPALVSQQLGFEQYVLVQRRGDPGPNIYLDHDAEDPSTLRYLKKFDPDRLKPRFQRRYLDDVYGIIDGVRLGLGHAVLPKHLIRGDRDFRIIHPSRTIDLPVYLHYYEQPFYTRLQQATLQALTTHCPTLLK